MKPYVGVTGIMYRQQAACLAEFAPRLQEHERLLMLGTLVSYKTLRGIGGSDPSNPKQFPILATVEGLMVENPAVLNLAHYNSRKPHLLSEMKMLLQWVPNLDGVQLNIAWPSVDAVKWLHYQGRTVVLQVGQEAFSEVGSSPIALVAKLAKYEGYADYVLFDPSGGLGWPFDEATAKIVFEVLLESRLEMSFGVAGGLGPGRLESLDALRAVYPDLSWDAQGQLRTNDELDLRKSAQYLEESLELLIETGRSA